MVSEATGSGRKEGSSADEAAGAGLVVLHSCEPRSPHSHEYLTHTAIARQLAAIKGYRFDGDFDPSRRYDEPLYFVPADTLLAGSMQQLGIAGEQDLFGGVVPHPFAGTKTISHDLPPQHAHAPDGWSPSFARQVRENVLPGYSAFTKRDACNAATELLGRGSVRIKKASGIGGHGQFVAGSMEQVHACLHGLDDEELRRDGLVVETNLGEVDTYSVGQVRVANLLATYCGTQRLTRNNQGKEVYGGSSLTVVRGDFDVLLRLDLEEAVRTAIAQARIYHAAALASFSGMIVSRANYDVARGIDEQGQPHSGVLEQSWRIGGASAAELAALGVFHADPAIGLVRASTTEAYGEDTVVPKGALVYYQGVDERIGPLTKYSQIEDYGNP